MMASWCSRKNCVIQPIHSELSWHINDLTHVSCPLIFGEERVVHPCQSHLLWTIVWGREWVVDCFCSLVLLQILQSAQKSSKGLEFLRVSWLDVTHMWELGDGKGSTIWDSEVVCQVSHGKCAYGPARTRWYKMAIFCLCLGRNINLIPPWWLMVCAFLDRLNTIKQVTCKS